MQENVYKIKRKPFSAPFRKRVPFPLKPLPCLPGRGNTELALLCDFITYVCMGFACSEFYISGAIPCLFSCDLLFQSIWRFWDFSKSMCVAVGHSFFLLYSDPPKIPLWVFLFCPTDHFIYPCMIPHVLFLLLFWPLLFLFWPLLFCIKFRISL